MQERTTFASFMVKWFVLFCTGIVVFVLSSCKGKNEIVPAYIHIDSLALTIKNPAQGSNVHRLNAIGLYVDEEFLGIFELPATIPARYAGQRKISVTTYMNLNGSSSRFSLFNPTGIADTTAILTPGKIATISTISITFRGNTNFKWVEDFEDNNASINTFLGNIPPDDTTFISTASFDLNGRFAGNSKVFNILLHACDTLKYAAIGHFDNIELPSDGSDIFLEFDVKSPLPLQLSLLRTVPNQGTEFVKYLFVNSTGGIWKRFYTNLVYETAAQPAGTTFKIIFDCFKPNYKTDETLIQFDNFRLTYLN